MDTRQRELITRLLSLSPRLIHFLLSTLDWIIYSPLLLLFHGPWTITLLNHHQ